MLKKPENVLGKKLYNIGKGFRILIAIFSLEYKKNSKGSFANNFKIVEDNPKSTCAFQKDNPRE